MRKGRQRAQRARVARMRERKQASRLEDIYGSHLDPEPSAQVLGAKGRRIKVGTREYLVLPNGVWKRPEEAHPRAVGAIV